MRLLVTTRTGNEYLAANLLEQRVPEIEETDARPRGLKGLILVDSKADVDEESIARISEVEKVIGIERELLNPEVREIASLAGEVAAQIPDGTRFAVRCTRRGSHEYSSVDVERLAGAAVLARDEEHEVDLDDPDHILRVEVIGDWVGIGLQAGEDVHKKYVGKPDARQLTSKTTIVQRLYESWDPRGTERIGEGLGRAAQAFEIDRLVVGLEDPTASEPLDRFTDALDKGITSRYEVQKKTYAREGEPVPVAIADIHQMARRAAGSGALVIATDPRGRTIQDVQPELGEQLQEAEQIYVFNGSNEGLPTGLFSLADHVLDLAPSITFGTDQAITAAIAGLITAWQPSEV